MKTRLAALTFALTLLVGCGDLLTPRELEDYRPQTGARIQRVSFGWRVAGDDGWNIANAVGTNLPADATAAIVWFEWANAQPGDTVTVRWLTHSGALQHEKRITLGTPSGRQLAASSMTNGRPLTPGRYRVELVENDTKVTEIPYRVVARRPAP